MLQRWVNVGATSIRRLLSHRLFIIAIGTLFVMALLELIKQCFFPNLTPWVSRGISIAFVACVVATAAYGILSDALAWNETIAGEISRRQQIERALITDRSFLRVLMDHIPDPIYFKDTQGRFMRINRAAAAQLGLSDPQQAVGKTDFDFYTPEHAQAAFCDEQQVLHSGQAMLSKEECETQPNRPAVWVATTRLPIRDEWGTVIGTFGISRDITAKKNAEIALQKSEERYRAIIEQSADGIALADENGLVTEWNHALEHLTALRRSEAVGRPLWEIEDELACADRVRRDLQITNFSVQISAGCLHGCIVRDVTAHKQAQERLLYLSTHDVLTGLYNRACFHDTLTQPSQAELYPMSVVMIDIDGMKRVNDTLGHAAGDELLRRTAQVLAGTFRGDDMIARVGGDEFAVLLHRTNSAAALVTLERLRLKLREHNGGTTGVPLNLSIGVATAAAHDGLAQALATADRQMYEDKEKQRGERL